MADREEQRPRRSPSGGERIEGRDFAGTNVANTEVGQTRDKRERPQGESADDRGGLVADTEAGEVDESEGQPS